MKVSLVAVGLASVLFTGCSLGPWYERPPTASPEAYRGQVDTAEATSFADLPWWEVFRDEALKALVEEALKNNFDLRVAAARVEQARALVGVVRADLFPQLGYDGGLGRSSNVSQLSVVVLPGKTSDTFRGAFDLAWEFDVWGRIRRSTEAALAELLASEEFRRGVILSLVSEVAQAYFELRELDLEVEIA